MCWLGCRRSGRVRLPGCYRKGGSRFNHSRQDAACLGLKGLLMFTRAIAHFYSRTMTSTALESGSLTRPKPREVCAREVHREWQRTSWAKRLGIAARTRQPALRKAKSSSHRVARLAAMHRPPARQRKLLRESKKQSPAYPIGHNRNAQPNGDTVLDRRCA